MQKLRWKALLAFFKFKRLVEGWGATRKLDYDKKDLYLYVANIVEYKTRARSCHKEPETVKWLEEWAPKAKTLCEVGANVGQYSIIAGSLGLNVYACEPAYQNVYAVNRNATLNGLDEKISPFQIACSSENKVGTFTYFDATSGSARGFYNKEGKFHEHREPELKKATMVMRLDDFLETFGLLQPDMLKIDVDGAELEVLEGATGTLSHPNLKTILLEVDHDLHDAQKLLTLVEGKGFAVVSKHNRSREVYNYIFEKK